MERLVATSVKGAVVGAAQRHGELIADPAAQGPRLHKSEVMGVARLPPAQQAWSRRYELQVGAIAVPARFAQREGALLDMPENRVVDWRQLGQRRSKRLRRCGRGLLARPRLASAPVPSEGRCLAAAKFHAGAQGGHQLGAAFGSNWTPGHNGPLCKSEIAALNRGGHDRRCAK